MKNCLQNEPVTDFLLRILIKLRLNVSKTTYWLFRIGSKIYEACFLRKWVPHKGNPLIRSRCVPA